MVTSEEKIISRNANRSENPTQGNGRPVTDHCVNLKPEWFEDMLQKRRHSDQEVRPTNDNSIFGSDEEEWIEKKEKVDIKKVSLIQTDPILDVQRLKLSMKPFLSSRRASMSINDPYPIPALPAGQKLMIEILENWGDEETIGLNGIEIFESVEGKIENFKNFSLKHKSSINDESTIRRKLLCPPFRTHDDNHIWTCDWNPFSSDSIQICITFNNTIRLALLRFWNYNKSRIYSYRGIKTVQVSLDDQIIFKGEIARADGELRCQPGRLGDVSVILFFKILIDLCTRL